MRYRILGPLRVFDGVGWCPIRTAQQRVVLAVLLTAADREVSIDRLIDEVWPRNPPRTASTLIRGHVLELRRAMGTAASALMTRRGGYELMVEPRHVDAGMFAELAAGGRTALTAGRLAEALDLLSQGLGLWRGRALADVPECPAAVVEVARLERSRLAAVEDRTNVLLSLGRHAEAAEDLSGLVEEHPLRETLHRQLMLALYRSARRGEALRAYQRARQVLVAELGLEPGPDLRQLHQAILTDDPVLLQEIPAADAASRTAPAQLPPDAAGFTGRKAQLKRLDELLPTDADPPSAVVISIVAGMAAVGKTALAVHWAHRVRERFPDGQLYLNLRGYASETPVRPIEALGFFLRALGMPAEQIPVGVEEAAATYRSLLSGRRMLVLLDNAGHPDQVRLLLPASPGSLVLVTSRDRLSGLIARDGAVLLRLDVLAADEALVLLGCQLGEERVRAERAAAAELVRLCGYLPLAIRIAAAKLAGRSPATIAGYLEWLRRSDLLAALEVAGDPQAAVRVTFGHSYSALPVDAQRIFRLLGLAAGTDIAVESAAALGGASPADAERLLDRLTRAHLIDEPTDGRYAMHDLIRLYAAELAAGNPEPDRRQALGRLYRFPAEGGPDPSD